MAENSKESSPVSAREKRFSVNCRWPTASSLATSDRFCLGLLWFVAALVLAGPALAATRYVDLNNRAPVAPYTSWNAAATNIQDAVDAAAAGDDIVVTDGVYQAGARAVYGMSNRVAVTKAVTVRSVNGPEVTLIQGYQAPGRTNGDSAMRSVYLTNGAVLAGFTLTNGATQAIGTDDPRQEAGGGVWCESPSAVVSNCILTGNSAYDGGGGAYSGALYTCTLMGNWSYAGGGGYDSILNNCVLTGNSASAYGGAVVFGLLRNCMLAGNFSAQEGGGADTSMLSNCTLIANSASFEGGGGIFSRFNNCILYYNKAQVSGDNYDDGLSILNSCCTTPLPSHGTGNITAEPQLANLYHLSAGSPCRGAGSPAYASGVDIDGEPWANPPSIGCDEYWSGSVTGALSVAFSASYTNVTPGFSVDLQGTIAGRVSASRWDFGDGVVVSNRSVISHAWGDEGDYVLELRAYNETFPGGVAASVPVHVAVHPVHYVALASTNPVPPFTSWATAATNIQDAVEAVVPGALVLVSNGVYETGARVMYGMSNRLAVTKAVTVRSINGPEVTVIRGYQVRGTPSGASAVRCVLLTNGATLSGFTLTNGASSESGGGVLCQSASAVVSNCVLTGNSAYWGGGGASGGTLNNCELTGNSANENGGGAAGATLNNCVLTGNSAHEGGGAYYATLNNCTLAGNSASSWGGGAASSTLNNCLLTGNWAYEGGGAYAPNGGSTLNNCTLTGNSASNFGGGAYYVTLNNCTLSGNSAVVYGGGAYESTLDNCVLTGNSSLYGGGAYYATLNNCIAYYNTARVSGDNYDFSSRLNYCCTIPAPLAGSGNITSQPELASMSHLSTVSPCRGAGSALYASGVDIDSEPWANPPSMGCDEYWSGSVTGALSVAIIASYTNVAAGFQVDFQAAIAGRVSASQWDFGDGVVASNRPYVAHVWRVAGDYVVELRAYNESYPDGLIASMTVHVAALPVHYVALSSQSPDPPYSSWDTAATNIQDAVEAATLPGALVLVSNGVYQAGARVVYGMSNRVAVTRPVAVRSANGSEVTVIAGYQMPGAPNGYSAIRCVYLTNGAILTGFTLTNGATQTFGDIHMNESGGGVWCESPSAVVSNCVFTGNSAGFGGGAFSGTLNNCILISNKASSGGGAVGGALTNCTFTSNSADTGGGASDSTLYYCTLAGNSASGFGGGASGSTLNNCILTGNSASYGGGAGGGALNTCTVTGNFAVGADGRGGGTYSGTLNNCTLAGNSAFYGAGAYSGMLNNCALTGNSADRSGGGVSLGTLNNCTLTSNSANDSGGGAYSSVLNNCIVYLNTTGLSATNYDDSSTLNYCCTAPLPRVAVATSLRIRNWPVPRISAPTPPADALAVLLTQAAWTSTARLGPIPPLSAVTSIGAAR